MVIQSAAQQNVGEDATNLSTVPTVLCTACSLPAGSCPHRPVVLALGSHQAHTTAAQRTCEAFTATQSTTEGAAHQSQWSSNRQHRRVLANHGENSQHFQAPCSQSLCTGHEQRLPHASAPCTFISWKCVSYTRHTQLHNAPGKPSQPHSSQLQVQLILKDRACWPVT